MTLVYDDGKANEPGVHALLVGVSAYDYVRGGRAQPATQVLQDLSTNLAQLVGPAESARNIANFLLGEKDNLTKPLRTLRLLASPGPAEKQGPPDRTPSPVANFDSVLPATAANIATALAEWQKVCCRSADEIALFYFGGHGSQISRTNAILLADDFLGGLTVFDRAIEVNDIWLGMANSAFVKTIAQTQYYFIDACRVDYSLFQTIRRTGTFSPFVVQDLGQDQRTAPIFYAAGPGQEAKAFPQKKTTRFGERLLRCLGGEAGEFIRNNWIVTIGQLTNSLSKLSQLENDAAGSKIDSFDIGGTWGDNQTCLLTLKEAPKISCKFRFSPSDMRKDISLVLDNFTPPPLRFDKPLGDPHRFDCPAGTYTIVADPADSFPPGFLNVRPPFTEVLIEKGRFSCL